MKGRRRLPSHSPHPKGKGLRHSHGYREAGEATNLPKAMESAQRPFSTFHFPDPSRYAPSQQATGVQPRKA